jgi:hypothetical protein
VIADIEIGAALDEEADGGLLVFGDGQMQQSHGEGVARASVMFFEVYRGVHERGILVEDRADGVEVAGADGFD